MEAQEHQVKLLENISFSLQEITKIVRVVSQPAIKEVLEKTLNSHEKRLVYKYMDGDKTVATIKELTGVNVRFISEWGQEWEKLGIVETDSNASIHGRRRKLFDLSLYGISIDENSKSEE
jgi:hypothetical protein